MKQKHMILFLTSLCIVISIVCGCGPINLFPGKAEEKESQVIGEAEYAVEVFMSKLTEAMEPEGDYEIRALFEEAEGFSEIGEQGIICLSAALKRLKYEIHETDLEEDRKALTFILEITDVDISSIVSNHMGSRVDSEKISEDIEDENAPTRVTLCPITLIKEEPDSEWEIADASDIITYFVDPIISLIFLPVAGDPVDALSEFLDALGKGDVYGNNTFLSAPVKWEQLYPDGTLEKIENAFYDTLSCEVLDVSYDGNSCTVQTRMEVVDILFVNSVLASDLDVLIALYEAVIISGVMGTGPDLSEVDRLVGEKGSEIIYNEQTHRVKVDAMFLFVLNGTQTRWLIKELPAVLTEKSYDFESSDPAIDIQAKRIALDNLFDKKAINSEEYDWFISYFGLDLNYSGIVEDISSQGWVDPNTDEPETYYIAEETNGVKYVVIFDSPWPGVEIFGAYYLDEYDEPMHEFSRIMGETDVHFTTSLIGGSGYTIPVGMYRLVLRLPDGSILAESSIEVR